MIHDDDLRALLAWLDRPWAGFRKVRKGVKKRLHRHMRQLGCENMREYMALLDRQPEQRAVCEACLAVTISRFFRDRRLWATLQEHLLPVLIRRFEDGMRIWSAGCANGEEPYSLAMVRHLLAQSHEKLPPFEILASDNRPQCLENARQGRYSMGSIKEIPPDLRPRFFTISPNGRRFEIKTEVRQGVRWLQHDLLHGPAGSAFQLIFLRNNLLTYHQGAVLQAAFERIVQALAPGGLLIVGSHERLPEVSRALLRDERCPWAYWVQSD